MAFSESELKRIDATVGDLCRRMSPARFADELRFVYEIDGHGISVFEERPPWDRKWHIYDPEARKRDLRTQVRVVEEDSFGAFFG